VGVWMYTLWMEIPRRDDLMAAYTGVTQSEYI
jgi:hypothetical protein